VVGAAHVADPMPVRDGYAFPEAQAHDPWGAASRAIVVTAQPPSSRLRFTSIHGGSTRWHLVCYSGSDQPMQRIVLIVEPDAAMRDRIRDGLAVHGWRVLLAVSAGDAIDQLGALEAGARLTAIVVDRMVMRGDRVLWTTHPQITALPLLVLATEAPERAELPANVRFVVPRATPVTDLLAMLTTLWRGELSPPPPGLAKGTGRTPASQLVAEIPVVDLHAYAVAKLSQYLGAARGAATLSDVTREVGIAAIESTADLHRVAVVLRSRGTLEAAVAALLSGRATLLDSDRTLRSS